MNQVTISKPVYRVLSSLTGENRVEIALELATRDLLRLKLKEVEDKIQSFEKRYQQKFPEFKQAWDNDKIASKHSYEIERDYWEWEAAVADDAKLRQFMDELP
ncbi:MAG: hypothetical protein HY782_21355 [Chloroflexi bacterium]|nr:hypothetical protein [Chloroflexota bacterium]